MLVKGQLVFTFLFNILIIILARPDTDTRFFTWKPEYMETEFDSLEDTITGENDSAHDLVDHNFERTEEKKKDYSNSNSFPAEQLVQKTKLLKACFKIMQLHILDRIHLSPCFIFLVLRGRYSQEVSSSNPCCSPR